MTSPKQKPRRLTELYKDFLEVEKKQQEFTKQKKKFIKEFNSIQSQIEGLQKDIKNSTDQNHKKKLEAQYTKLSSQFTQMEEKKKSGDKTIADSEKKLRQLRDSINAQEKTLKNMVDIGTGGGFSEKEIADAQKELAIYNKLVNERYIKERNNLFDSVQNICSKTNQITPAIKEILEIDFTQKASQQKLKIAKAAAKALTTGLDNSVSIAKIVTSAPYYVKEAKKIDIDDKAKTDGSFFVKLLSDAKTQELLQNILPQINEVAGEVAPILVSKTLDYLEKTGKKYEQQEAKAKDFAKYKLEILEKVAEHSGGGQSIPKELRQKLDAIQKEEETISKANTSAKQSSIRQSLGKTISTLKTRGFDDEHINDTFVPIMSSVIDNASKKPQEVTGAIKAIVDLGLAANSKQQAKAVTELVLSELVRDTLKDQAIQNLATNQTGFITATIQEIVRNNNSLKERAKKIGVTDDSIKDLTEMATGVITTGLKFGGKLLDGLANEREQVQEVIEVTIQTGKKVAKIIDDNKELKAEHIAVITDELKVVADNALELMNRESVQGVITALGRDIAQDKELPKIIKEGVKTIATIAAPNVTKLENFNKIVDFAVDLGVNITSAGLEGADTVNILVRNTVLPVATNIAITVLKNTDKINELAKQVEDITEESKKQQNNNPVEKATNVINNGLEVASNVMNLLNDGEIRSSLTQNLNKLGEGLQSAKYVENLVTTVAKNILPASEIIGDRDTINHVIADTAILAEKTAAAVLSEEKNITAVFDGATHGIAVAKSLLSSDKQTVETADSISKVVESAAVLLTDENVSEVISKKIPDYIATYGQTFVDAVVSQFATRQAKQVELVEEERFNDEIITDQSSVKNETIITPKISNAAAPIIQGEAVKITEENAIQEEVQVVQNDEDMLEQPTRLEEVKVEDELTLQNSVQKNKISSRDKAIEVATTVAKNVTNILSVLQTEEGRGSKEAIVSNLSKLGDQIREQGYIQKIVPKIFDSLILLEKRNLPATQEKSAESIQANQQRPSVLDQQKDPMAPEISTKITSKDVIATVKSIKDIPNIDKLVQDSSAVTEQIVSIALQQSDAAINIATSLIALGQNASEVLARKSLNLSQGQTTPTGAPGVEVDLNAAPQRYEKAQKMVADDRELVQNLNDTLAKNILIVANDSKIQELVTKELPSYIQSNKGAILAITKQLTGQYQAQIGAIGLSEEVINQTADLSVKLLTDKNIAPIYELVGNVVNNAGMSNSSAQSDIALLINHIYNTVINKDNKEVRKEPAQNAINKIGDIIFSANSAELVRSVVTQNIPRLLRENEKAIAGLAEEFLERTALGQKISSRISIDVERALKVAEEKSDTFLSVLENYHKKNYAGIVKNVIDLATSPKVIKFLGSTAARTVSSHVKRLQHKRQAPIIGR